MVNSFVNMAYMYDKIPFIDVDHKQSHQYNNYCFEHLFNDNFQYHAKCYIHRGSKQIQPLLLLLWGNLLTGDGIITYKKFIN